MRYSEPTEHTGMVSEPIAQCTNAQHLITQEVLDRDYLTLEESKARLQRIVYNHYHNN